MNEKLMEECFLDATACGFLEDEDGNLLVVAPKVGILPYLMPQWVHRIKVWIKCTLSNKYEKCFFIILELIYEAGG